MKVLRNIVYGAVILIFLNSCMQSIPLNVKAVSEEKEFISKDSFTIDYELEETTWEYGVGTKKQMINHQMNCIVTIYEDNSIEIRTQALDDVGMYENTNFIDFGDISFLINDFDIEFKSLNLSGWADYYCEKSFIERYDGDTEIYSVCACTTREYHTDINYGDGFTIQLTPSQEFEKSYVEIFNHVYSIGENTVQKDNLPIYKKNFRNTYRIYNKSADTDELHDNLNCIIYVYDDNSIEVIGQFMTEEYIGNVNGNSTYKDFGEIQYPIGYYNLKSMSSYDRKGIQYYLYDANGQSIRTTGTYVNGIETHTPQFIYLGAVPNGDRFHFILTPTSKFQEGTSVNILGQEIILPMTEESELLGDTNGDGDVSVLDIILLQQWLHGKNVHLEKGQNADLYKDNQLNIYDLALLKRMLLKER